MPPKINSTKEKSKEKLTKKLSTASSSGEVSLPVIFKIFIVPVIVKRFARYHWPKLNLHYAEINNIMYALKTFYTLP